MTCDFGSVIFSGILESNTERQCTEGLCANPILKHICICLFLQMYVFMSEAYNYIKAMCSGIPFMVRKNSASSRIRTRGLY